MPCYTWCDAGDRSLMSSTDHQPVRKKFQDVTRQLFNPVLNDPDHNPLKYRILQSRDGQIKSSWEGNS